MDNKALDREKEPFVKHLFDRRRPTVLSYSAWLFAFTTSTAFVLELFQSRVSGWMPIVFFAFSGVSFFSLIAAIWYYILKNINADRSEEHKVRLENAKIEVQFRTLECARDEALKKRECDRDEALKKLDVELKMFELEMKKVELEPRSARPRRENVSPFPRSSFAGQD